MTSEGSEGRWSVERASGSFAAMDIYGGLYRKVLMPGWERLRGRRFFERLDYVERAQWQPPSTVRALQLMELRRLLVHAQERIPYYRELFARHGFEPHSVHDVRDLQKLPPLTKEIARSRYADIVDARTARTHIHKATSGSSGQPFELEYDPDSEIWRRAIKWRSYRWAGYRPGTRALHYWGMPVPLHGARGLKVKLDRALRRELYVDCMVQDPRSLEQAVGVIREFRPKVIVGFTLSLAQLARFITEQRLRDWADIAVIGGAEPLLEADRKVLVEAFGEGIFDSYGARETMLLAFECESHDGLHTMDDGHVVEIVVDGRPARPGEIGEVLVTDLHNFGMPLIRYRNGDLAEASDGAPCSCGRGLARPIAKVIGRRTEQLRDADGQPVSGLMVPALIALFRHHVEEYQVVQRASGEVVLRIVAGPRFDAKAMAEVVTRAEGYLRLPVRIEKVGRIDRGPGGKHRVVVIEPPSSQADKSYVAAN